MIFVFLKKIYSFAHEILSRNLLSLQFWQWQKIERIVGRMPGCGERDSTDLQNILDNASL